MKKNLLMLGSLGFIFGVTNFGLLNKVFLTAISVQLVTLHYKSSYYRLMVDDLASHMTLVG